jgi:4-hydroxy-tetrahydrodipicolinate reductase
VSTRLLLIGHGRMGRLIEAHAAAHDCEITGIITGRSGASAITEAPDADVAVDFSHGSVVRDHVIELAGRGMNVVIGTTGWQADEAVIKGAATAADIGVLFAANFSLGMMVFRAAVEAAAARFAGLDVGAWIHEAHHAAKKDAPSGTALMLKRVLENAGYMRPIDVSSTRAGSIPGTHTVGFDAAAETVTFIHEVRDRAVFAHGALEAAKWLKGRRGWYGVEDLLA